MAEAQRSRVTTGDGGTARGLRVGGAACTNTAADGADCGVRRGGDKRCYYNYYFIIFYRTTTYSIDKMRVLNE